MASTSDRYPLATADGKWIPSDVLKPYGMLTVAFTNVVSSAVDVPDGVEMAIVSADQPCILRFGANASVPADKTLLTDAILIGNDYYYSIAPTAATFTVIRQGSTNGTLTVNFIKNWAGLSLEIQNQRR